MPDETLTQLYTGASWPNGYSVSNLMLLMDVTDLSMANTGTDKGITVANWLSQYFHAGSDISLAPGSTGLTITSTVLPEFHPIFSRTGVSVALRRLLGRSGDGGGPSGFTNFTVLCARFRGTSTGHIASTAFVERLPGCRVIAVLAGRGHRVDPVLIVLTMTGSHSNPTFTWIRGAHGNG